MAEIALLAECEELIRNWRERDGLLSVMVGPSGPQRCSDELLVKGAELAAKYGLGYHTHLPETRIQAETGFHLWGRFRAVERLYRNHWNLRRGCGDGVH